MYFVAIILVFPVINALLTVQIHRNALYQPSTSCALIRNATWPHGSSIQSCIWECQDQQDCQTATYFEDENVCSLFLESCTKDAVVSSGNTRANVICVRKNQSNFLIMSIQDKKRLFLL